MTIKKSVLLLPAALLLLPASPALAEPVTYYEVVAQHSGKCLDVKHAGLAHGADVIQGKCLGGRNQQWSLKRVGRYYRLVARHSGRCLDVYDADRDHGADVVQADCWSPGYNQQWRLRRVPGPKWADTGLPFELVARHSKKCLDVQDRSRAHAANVLQATCSGGSNQIWRLRTP